ncbi:PepSY-associated TM helix domain-containing protein [Turneriella parva]|uniref:PepSY domain-containing protein n=1 Tax=Turneriella parva (strain ATCC BAA-1111 / DSM 21527 / NCTC 11395 / H) TaxID=869212 RepID=I4B698_TURPD|nr:PepSY-associated TM helix domain-containing protein [Turneriella parva]AFM12805.1 hypothetical protein Turpa_2159 [Turneriella parva DSM 21527]
MLNTQYSSPSPVRRGGWGVRFWHRRIAILSAGFLLLTAVTGILWAYAPHLYFKEGYLKKKSLKAAPSLSAARLAPQEAIRLAEAAGKVGPAESVVLRAEGGRLVFEVVRREGKAAHSQLVDAISGEKLSPLDEKMAAAVAAEYVVGNPTLKNATVIDNYRHRSGKLVPSVYRVAFVASGNPEIYIDRNSAAIVEESDDARAFHFWVMKLHQLQFFGTKKELTLIPGLALILLVITGMLIWWRRYRALS